MISRLDVILKAKGFVGTPFHKHGRIKHVGIDCVGLLFGVAWELGYQFPNDTAYSIPDIEGVLPDRLRALGFAERPVRSQWKPGMVAILSFTRKKRPNHAGILAPGRIIHVLTGDKGRGGCAEHLLDEFWYSRILTAFDYPSIES